MRSEKLLLTNGSERGNALFLILIAVALFAALSYAITQSGRGSGTVDKESAMIAAGQVVEYPASLRTAVTRMIITGTAASAIKFDTTSLVGIFASDGGGATNVPPPASAGTATAWTYVPAYASGADGNFIYGVGTTDSEALAVLPGITLTVCTQIQKGLGFASTTPVVGANGPVDWGTAAAYDAAGSPSTVKGAGATLNGQAFACFQNTTAGLYQYYHAIIEQ
ncbi:MAG: hypothetical protein HY052_04025 [Proteobacteria bacterium]|nr:hypothetical protein [Pseudomonadota bacterium]